MINTRDRVSVLTDGLKLSSPGLEISPLYRPTVRKHTHNVFYTDYCSAAESRDKHSSYSHDDIMELDFVWTPGKRLAECATQGLRFDWAISSHVMEHVPNPIGWLLDIFEVMNEGATYSIALPHKEYCYDKFRRNTDCATLVDAWIRKQSNPSPYQIFEFLTRSIELGTERGDKAFKSATKLEEAIRHYTDTDALNFVSHSWTSGAYIDVHCSAFTPDSFVEVIKQLHDLGILNIEISEPIVGPDEFFVKLKKLGEPRVGHPGNPYTSGLNVHNGNAFSSNASIEELTAAISRSEFEKSQLVQSLSTSEASIANLNTKLTELSRKQIEEQIEKQQLQLNLHEVLQNHMKLKSSVSWRITKPIRVLGKMLGR
jgi:replicative DNA helicase